MIVISIPNKRIAKNFVSELGKSNKHWGWSNTIESWRKKIFSDITPNTKAVYLPKNNFWVVAQGIYNYEILQDEVFK